MKYFVVAFFAVWLSSVFAEKPESVEIRFCPASAVRTYPLESRRDLQSLLLQNAAIINHGHTPFDVKEIHLELLQAGQVFDTKKLDTKAIHRLADRSAKIQSAGVLKERTRQRRWPCHRILRLNPDQIRIRKKQIHLSVTRCLVCGLGSFISHRSSLGRSRRVCAGHCKARW